MPYYPKSQVKTNLYANPGDLLVASNETPYTGYYWKNSKNQYWSGKTPNDTPTISLIPAFDPINSEIVPDKAIDIASVVTLNDPGYQLSQGVTLGNPNNYKALPSYESPPPTLKDYQIGEFRRYFCKKANEVWYLEINKTTYTNLVEKNPAYLWELYSPFNLPWQITGDRDKVARTNFNITELTSKRLQLPKFGDYLKNDYLKYYR